MKYEKEFRKDHPETIGETDREFDEYNYIEWIDKQVYKLIEKEQEKLIDREKNCKVTEVISPTNRVVKCHIPDLDEKAETIGRPIVNLDWIETTCPSCRRKSNYLPTISGTTPCDNPRCSNLLKVPVLNPETKKELTIIDIDEILGGRN